MELKKLYRKQSVKKAGKLLVSVIALVYIVGITIPHLILPLFKKSVHE
jgi:hypothetical protein